MQLHQKVKSLIAENEGIQAEKELAEEHNKQVTMADPDLEGFVAFNPIVHSKGLVGS